MRKFLTLLFLVTILVGLLAMPVVAQAANLNPRVLPAKASAYGKTYAQWAETWWQWAYSIPAEENPLLDTTGDMGDEGQTGPVWFLAGVWNESGIAERTLTVPAGKALFFPIINGEWDAPVDSGTTPEELWGLIDANYNLSAYVVAMKAEVDGRAIEDLFSYRARDPKSSFIFKVPADNLLGYPADSEWLAVADGYYLLLAPLPVGAHTIHFSTEYANPVGGFSFTLDITYHISVAPRAR